MPKWIRRGRAQPNEWMLEMEISSSSVGLNRFRPPPLWWDGTYTIKCAEDLKDFIALGGGGAG